MNGVTVLTEHTERAIPVFVTAVALLVLAALLAVCLMVTIRMYKKKRPDRQKVLAWFVFLCIGSLLTSVGLIGRTFVIHNNLVVTIDDSVSFNEFNNRYEIIDRDGKLYTVREIPEMEGAGEIE